MMMTTKDTEEWFDAPKWKTTDEAGILPGDIMEIHPGVCRPNWFICFWHWITRKKNLDYKPYRVTVQSIDGPLSLTVKKDV